MSKESKGIIITERPAFMIVVDRIEQPFEDGYTLLVDVDKMQASIINLTKGGKDSMVKQEVVALEGYEDIVAQLYAKRDNLEADKQDAIERAKAEVEAKYAEIFERIDNSIRALTVVNEIEVPDEEPVAEEEVAVAEEVVENNGIAF